MLLFISSNAPVVNVKKPLVIVASGFFAACFYLFF